MKPLLRRAPTRTRILLVLLMTGGVACACQVPVFRYALERWEPDHYQLFVLSDGPLDATVREQLAPIQNGAGGKAKNLAPVDWKFADVNQVRDPRLQEAWKAWPNKELPMLALFYPAGSDAPDQTPAYTAPADKKNIEAIMTSPVRATVLERLTQGHSAVWIFVPSGHKDQDKAGYETLQQQLKLDAEWLELPSPEELEIAPEILTNTKIKLQIGFSIVKLDPHDEAEKFLVEALLNSEPDLKSFDAPLAFPVFGRGRVLYGLVGKGIAADTIRSASSFMVGPCSCQVKNQNPGFDLLMTYDWKEAVGDTLISEPIQGPTGANLEPTLLTIPPGRSSSKPK